MPLYAFNGTWNSEKTEDLQTSVRESDVNTNVVRFRDAYDRGDTFYVNGVGTRVGWVGRAIGGAFGGGGQARLKEALDHLRGRLSAGERDIDIVGFSRGAALALAFANRIAKEVRDSRGGTAPIRFLGLFDVVGSFGLPFNLGPLRFQEYNVGYQLNLPPNVEYCFHAMALDERRQTFRVTRVRGAYEVWFRGAHSDIGGGNGNLGLNGIACSWLLRKAYAAGLPIREDAILAAAALSNPAARPQWTTFDPIKNRFRPVEAGDRIHDSIAGNDDDLDNPPAACPRETQLTELQVTRSALFKVV